MHTMTAQEIEVVGYEKVLFFTDEASGLRAIICIHNTALGPALGGTRMYPYNSFEEALSDAKRLARGMTCKSALAQVPFGGGKSVIIADPQKDKTEELLLAFGRAVDSLEGKYICAEDSGTTTADMAIIRTVTPHVVGLAHEHSSGDPSPFTTWGVYRGIQSALYKIYGTPSVKGRHIAIQGLGAVGAKLALQLFWEGATLTLSDFFSERADSLAKQLHARIVPKEEILSTTCDILAPCALGGIINTHTIPHLRCKAIAGSANNQLLEDTDSDTLMHLGILYAPDFVINAGGLVNVTHELMPEGYNPRAARDRTDTLYDQLIRIYEIAEQEKISTHKAALNLVSHYLNEHA